MQEFEWIRIGVHTGAGKTAWLQSVTYGKKLPGHVDLSFRTATGELVKSGERLYVEVCGDWGVNLRVRGVQALVCKPLLSVGDYATMDGVTVLYGDKCYLFHNGSNVAKEMSAWIQKEMRDSQYQGCVQREQRIQHLQNPVDTLTKPLPGHKIRQWSEHGGQKMVALKHLQG